MWIELCYLLHHSSERVSVALVNSALDSGTWQDLYTALCNPILKLPINITKCAAPLYYEEMKADKLECGVSIAFAFKYDTFIVYFHFLKKKVGLWYHHAECVFVCILVGLLPFSILTHEQNVTAHSLVLTELMNKVKL